VLESEKYDLSGLFSNDIEKKYFFDLLKANGKYSNDEEDYFFLEKKQAIETHSRFLWKNNECIKPVLFF